MFVALLKLCCFKLIMIAYCKAKIAASFKYCFLGVAPMYLDPNNISPEAVEQSAADVMGEKLHFPRAYFSEVRADWKFMKDNGDMCNNQNIRILLYVSIRTCRNC